jgi:ribosomal protein S18 acetylase RimI-like enzyme
LTDEVLAIERVAFAAWPAAEIASCGGWRLRFNHGVTNRGGSVWPGPGASERPLDARIEEVERWYAERDASACYQLSPAADPPALDGALAARGYEVHSPVSVELASADAVAAHAAPDGQEASCTGAPCEEWFEISGRHGRFRGAEVAVYRALLGRLRGRAGFALVRAGGEPAAVGLAVVEPPFAGVFSMLTLPAFRGRGLARSVLGALARFAQQRGASRLYLQVEVENDAARHLYARTGFARRYRYHYRRAPRPRPA